MNQRKVLVVDDYPDITSFMKNMLIKKGCQVFTASSLEEAWQICRSQHPDACSLDLHLKPCSFTAVGLLRKIRSFDPRILRVVFTRIRLFPTLEDEPREDDYHAWFTKPPVSKEEIDDLIELLATATPDNMAHG